MSHTSARVKITESSTIVGVSLELFIAELSLSEDTRHFSGFLIISGLPFLTRELFNPNGVAFVITGMAVEVGNLNGVTYVIAGLSELRPAESRFSSA